LLTIPPPSDQPTHLAEIGAMISPMNSVELMEDGKAVLNRIPWAGSTKDWNGIPVSVSVHATL
jgi:hypothetical protein